MEEPDSLENKRVEELSMKLSPPLSPKSSKLTKSLIQSQVIGPEMMKQLSTELVKKGFFVVDNFIGESQCKLLRDEIEKMYKEGLLQNEPSMKSNSDGSVEIIGESTFFATQLDLPKSKEPKELISYMQQISSILSKELNSLLGFDLKNTCEYHKIAVCTGEGGSLPKHLDNDGTNVRDTRKITAILYLNPLWKPEDEGKIRLYNVQSNNSRDIEPLNGRLLVFYSDLAVHEVLPYVGKELRATITVWLPVSSRKWIHEDKELYWKILMRHFGEYIT